jgi:hypothetical protein
LAKESMVPFPGIKAKNTRMSGARVEETRQEFQCRRLPGTVRAKETYDLSLGNLE